MHLPVVIASLSLIAVPLHSQATALRAVKADTLVSGDLPAARIVIGKPFRYVGGQVIDIFKVAGAEQHFFFETGPGGAVRRFYWIQFEHYYPDNRNTYDYSGIVQQPVQLGRLGFMGDIRTSENYFTSDNRPGSDSKAAEAYLRKQGLDLAGTFVTLRMFHLPDTTRRSELMIIYGERLSPGAAKDALNSTITAHARSGIAIP
jgi:hypothetical protein